MESKKNRLNALVVLMIVGLTSLSTITQAQTMSSAITVSNTPIIRRDNQWNLGTQLMFAAPLQELRDNHYRNGGGVAVEIFSPTILDPSSFLNIQFGTHLDYMSSGSESEMLDLRAYGTDPVKYRAQNESAGLHLIGRLITKEMRVTPYLDGIIGSRMLFSTSSVLIEEEPDCPHFETDFLSKNLTLVYGGSVGAMVKVNHMFTLDFRMTYSQGSAASFINLDNFDADINGSPFTTLHRDADEAEPTTVTTTTPRNPGETPEHTMLEQIQTPLLFFSTGVVFKW